MLCSQKAFFSCKHTHCLTSCFIEHVCHMFSGYSMHNQSQLYNHYINLQSKLCWCDWVTDTSLTSSSSLSLLAMLCWWGAHAGYHGRGWAAGEHWMPQLSVGMCHAHMCHTHMCHAHMCHTHTCHDKCSGFIYNYYGMIVIARTCINCSGWHGKQPLTQ